ncbi:MAG: lytic transglycosylase domain-containing protein [Clostridia bacterium]|nr:lytic transglycosylase domain-containing protein [Clostridia bacterium]
MTLKGKAKILIIVLISVLILFASFFSVSKGIMKIIYPQKYAEYVEKYSSDFGIDKNLLYAVIKTESSFKPDAVSSADAVGLTQITPETFEWLKTKLGEEDKNLTLTDPETSVKYGAFFLGYLLDEFGNTDTAIAAYHAGRGRVNEWLEDKNLSPDGITLSEIPIDETAHYVRKVNKALNVYNNLYNERTD